MAGKQLLSLYVSVIFFSCLSSSICEKDHFHEELLLKPLPSGHVYAHFQFITVWNVDINDPKSFSHYNLFPKSFGQIVNKHFVEELHLSLTQGQWQHEQWGYPVLSSPPGAELWVWFQDAAKNNVDSNWIGLTQALSGQFCASLNFLDSKVTSSPKMSFRREGVTSSTSNDSSLLRYATLPHEIVCTENLTPWKKLLPCDSQAGLASLFRALLLYSVKFHAMAVHVRPVCKITQGVSCESSAVELTQSLSVVFDPILRNGEQDWSLRKLFGKVLQSHCPLATSSKIYFDITGNQTQFVYKLSPKPSLIEDRIIHHHKYKLAVYDLKTELMNKTSINMAFKWVSKPRQVIPPQLYAHRYVTGHGEEFGGITSLLYNTHSSNSLDIVYFETFPWFLRMFLHTLKIENQDKDIKPDAVYYIAAKDRQRPCTLELRLTLPPNSITKLSIKFERSFLKWTEYPPDSHHGFTISSAVISTVLSSASNITGTQQRHSSRMFPSDNLAGADEGVFVRLYTEPLLISLPVPDFSMPYNVICLTCTVVAIAFGSFHNLATRQFDILDPNQPTFAKKVKNKFAALKERLFSKKVEAVVDVDKKDS